MRELIATTFLTLDGVMQAPGGSDEDTAAGFEYGGWSMTHDDRMAEVMGRIMGEPFDLVLGRTTYDLFAAFWPNESDEDGGKPLNDATKYVASRGRPALTWDPSVLIEGDAAEGVAKLSRPTARSSRCTAAATCCRHRCATTSSTVTTSGCS